MKCVLNDLPQHLNGVQVRTLTKLLQSLHFVAFKPFRGGLALVLWLVVLLRNRIVLALCVVRCFLVVPLQIFPV